MNTRLSLVAVVLHACAAAAAAVEALVLDVPSGGSKCLTEELRRGALSHASYRVAAVSTSATYPRNPARVTGPRGEEIHLAEAAERGEFRFRAAEDGGHTACFWTPRYERDAVVSVDVQWATAGGSGSRPAVAVANNQGPIASIAEELKKLEDSARLVHRDGFSAPVVILFMPYQSKFHSRQLKFSITADFWCSTFLASISASEHEMQRLNEDTATRIHSFTLLSLAMCIGVAGLQLWHLKSFFQKHHIL